MRAGKSVASDLVGGESGAAKGDGQGPVPDSTGEGDGEGDGRDLSEASACRSRFAAQLSKPIPVPTVLL